MEHSKLLPKLIGITEMQKFFNCSRQTLYVKYLPHLNRIPTKTNRVLYLYEDVIKLKEKIEEKEFEEVFIDNQDKSSETDDI